MPQQPYSIQPMSRDNLDVAIAWAAAAGWNPGLQDGDSFYAADPTGFWMGVLGDEMIATISAVKYGELFGFLGFYIVKPEYRGQGYGIQLWNAVMSTLKGRNVGLDGVVAQQQNYQKSGFQLAYRNIRYQGVVANEKPDSPAFVPLSGIPFKAIATYDRRFFPGDRSQFLRSWIHQPGSTALGIVRNDELAGYGVLRPCQMGYKVGPLFADDPALAEILLIALQAEATLNAPLYLDVPDVNPAAVALAEKYKMKPVFETARMYTQDCPDLAYDRLFGVTTFELG